MTDGVEEDRLTGAALSRIPKSPNVLRVGGGFHPSKCAAFVAGPRCRDDCCQRLGSDHWRKYDDQGGRPVRRLGSQWSAAPGVGDSQLAAAEIAPIENGINRLADQCVIRRWKAQSGRRATHPIQVPAYGKCTLIGHF